MDEAPGAKLRGPHFLERVDRLMGAESFPMASRAGLSSPTYTNRYL